MIISKLKFKNKLNAFGISQADDFNEEVVEMHHSEKQEILRDTQNKISRDEIDVLSKFNLLIKERILKVKIIVLDTIM
jgi:hypothetical protein